jgi:hypothetical protein
METGRAAEPAGAYRSALSRPRFLRALRAAYDGPDDVLDALWWLEHPLQPGPSGTRSPAAIAAEAQRALYRPSVTEATRARYRAAAERDAASRSAITVALGRVDDGRRASWPQLPQLPLMRTARTARTVQPTARSVSVGRPEEMFDPTGARPGVATLVRVPRATVYTVDAGPHVVCIFLVSDEISNEFRGETVPTQVFRDRGIALELDPELAASVGLRRALWLPSGEVRWWMLGDAEDA